MGAFYFQRDEDVSEKPEVLDIVLATGHSVPVVVYYLEEFWRRVNQRGESLGDGTGRGIMRGYKLAHLPLLVGLDAVYWSAVAVSGWVEEAAEGLLIPGFDDRFGKLAQSRAAATLRQQKHRAARRSGQALGLERSSKNTGERSSAPVAPQTIKTQRRSDVAAQVAGTVVPQRPTLKQRASQFDLLNIADLSICGKLMCWIADVSVMPRPVVINDEWHQLRVIAAGIRATTSKGVRSPMALFKSIVGKRQWTMLEPDEIQRAQRKLATYRNRLTNMQGQYVERVGPAADQVSADSLVAEGFGEIPSEPRKQTAANQAAALLRFESERQLKRG